MTPPRLQAAEAAAVAGGGRRRRAVRLGSVWSGPVRFGSVRIGADLESFCFGFLLVKNTVLGNSCSFLDLLDPNKWILLEMSVIKMIE